MKNIRNIFLCTYPPKMFSNIYWHNIFFRKFGPFINELIKAFPVANFGPWLSIFFSSWFNKFVINRICSFYGPPGLVCTALMLSCRLSIIPLIIGHFPLKWTLLCPIWVVRMPTLFYGSKMAPVKLGFTIEQKPKNCETRFPQFHQQFPVHETRLSTTMSPKDSFTRFLV